MNTALRNSDDPDGRTPWWDHLKDAIVKGSQVGSFALAVVGFTIPADEHASRAETLIRLTLAVVHALHFPML